MLNFLVRKDMAVSIFQGWKARAGVALLGALALVACAAPPAEQAARTPAALVAAESLVSVQSQGVSVGAAVAVDERRLLTNAHVLRQAGGEVRLRRADGSEADYARVIAVSPRMDLAVLEVPEGFVRPALPASRAAQPGEPVWALGPEGLGRALAAGQVLRPRVEMRGFGPGFTAGLGALMGFSGGPVVDGGGRLLGLTTALPDAGTATVLATATGVDLAGFAQGDRRQVFVLSIQAALAEAERLGALRPTARIEPQGD
ncbi:MAG: serine protease [Rubritepida sp.]|nr:serine protease [Rubritepida sp.]